jgi:hypothetical protein
MNDPIIFTRTRSTGVAGAGIGRSDTCHAMNAARPRCLSRRLTVFFIYNVVFGGLLLTARSTTVVGAVHTRC